jgi:hypothetical protein
VTINLRAWLDIFSKIATSLNWFEMTKPSRKSISALLSLLTGSIIGMGQALAYDKAVVSNHTQYDANITVKYAGESKILGSCMPDSFKVPAGKNAKDAGHWLPTSRSPGDGRGSCLITEVRLSMINGPSGVTKPQDSYRSSGTSYHEFHILDRGSHYRVMSRAEVDAEKYANGTPGFEITNKSAWPVTVSLDQVGCLYHDVIKPGATWKKTTGAVWFTISANTSMDGVDHINELLDCVYPVIQAVKFAAELVGTADGCAECGQLAMNDAEMFSATLAGTALYDAITNNTTAKKLAGQYAGPPYPFRCAHMPKYDIVGGPAKQMDVTLDAADILAIKTEACSINPFLEDPTSSYFSVKFMEQLADDYNAKVNSKNHKPDQDELSRMTEIRIFLEPSKNKKMARELANCKAKGSRHACLAMERHLDSITQDNFDDPVFDLNKFFTSQTALCSAAKATFVAQDPPICKRSTQAECNKGAISQLSDSRFPACGLLKGLTWAIDDKKAQEKAKRAKENAKRAKALAACEVTPKLKEAWYSKHIQEGLNGRYGEMAGTPLEIKRTGGGCT